MIYDCCARLSLYRYQSANPTHGTCCDIVVTAFALQSLCECYSAASFDREKMKKTQNNAAHPVRLATRNGIHIRGPMRRFPQCPAFVFLDGRLSRVGGNARLENIFRMSLYAAHIGCLVKDFSGWVVPPGVQEELSHSPGGLSCVLRLHRVLCLRRVVHGCLFSSGCLLSVLVWRDKRGVTKLCKACCDVGQILGYHSHSVVPSCSLNSSTSVFTRVQL